MARDRDNEIICAVSTPSGHGGISVLRVSGQGSFDLIRPFCAFLPKDVESHKIYYGLFRDQASGAAIDEVMLSTFIKGRSFTGEETVEISCHGNPLICREILQRLIGEGARPADRGEFTYRAFMNNRIDLVQAESVLSLIESKSAEASRMALRQLQGDLSKDLEQLEDDLIWCLAHIEAGIDFSTEGLDVVDLGVLRGRLDSVRSRLGGLVDSYRSGRVLKEGLRIALIGRPNVGKSSLLNNLLEQDRAIVTDIPGTTRDTVEGETAFRGQRLVFLDTAGLRESSDPVERLGIERSQKVSREADVTLVVFEAFRALVDEDIRLLRQLEPGKTMVVFNKADKATESDPSGRLKELRDSNFFRPKGSPVTEKVCFVSALDRTARSLILDEVVRSFQPIQHEGTAVLSSLRHFERLSLAHQSVVDALSSLQSAIGPEFVAVALKEALLGIQETLGKRFDDQVMDRVFKEFCIGK